MRIAITSGLSVGLSLLAGSTLAAELGYQLGKDQNLTTDFENIDTTGGNVFAGSGIRLGL